MFPNTTSNKLKWNHCDVILAIFSDLQLSTSKRFTHQSPTGAVEGVEVGKIFKLTTLSSTEATEIDSEPPPPSHPQTRPHNSLIARKRSQDPWVSFPAFFCPSLAHTWKLFQRRWVDDLTSAAPEESVHPASPGSVTMHSALLLSPQGHHKPSNFLFQNIPLHLWSRSEPWAVWEHVPEDGKEARVRTPVTLWSLAEFLVCQWERPGFGLLCIYIKQHHQLQQFPL